MCVVSPCRVMSVVCTLPSQVMLYFVLSCLLLQNPAQYFFAVFFSPSWPVHFSPAWGSTSWGHLYLNLPYIWPPCFILTSVCPKPLLLCLLSLISDNIPLPGCGPLCVCSWTLDCSPGSGTHLSSRLKFVPGLCGLLANVCFTNKVSCV